MTELDAIHIKHDRCYTNIRSLMKLATNAAIKYCDSGNPEYVSGLDNCDTWENEYGLHITITKGEMK